MATTQCEVVVSMVCGENLSGDQYELLTINSSGQVVKQTTVGDFIIGVLAEDPGTTMAGDRVAVALIGGGGILKCKAGDAITAGQVLICDATDGRASGKANIGALAADEAAFGIALEAAADGEIFEFVAQTVAAPHSA